MKKFVIASLVMLFTCGITYSQEDNNGRDANAKPTIVVTPPEIKKDTLTTVEKNLTESDSDQDVPLMLKSAEATADQVFSDNVIITGGLGVGYDMTSGYDFSFKTIALKENNLRIYFDDTSNTGSFPANDWCLVANDSDDGGDNYFAIQDATAGRKSFVVEAGAGENALYIEDSGDVGLGTSSPVTDLHIVSGNTPTIRLQQDLSQGWSSDIQNWDICAHEGIFFIRYATNGTTLPFKIETKAPSNSLYVKKSGNIGLGTESPQAKLDVTGDIKVEGVVMFDPVDTSAVAKNIGTMAMDSETSEMMYFNGTEWISVADKQEISLSNNKLSISGSEKTVSLRSYLDNTDDQQLELTDNTLSIEGGNSLDISEYINTDNQAISLSNDSLTISGSESSVDLSQYLDNTDAQEVSLSENLLSISGSNTSVDLSGLLDNTDEQVLALDDYELSISGGNSVDLSSLLEEQQIQIDDLNTQVEDLTQELSDLREFIEIVAETVGAKVVAKACSLDQNIPNPFTTSTTISYKISEFISSAYLAFYNQSGQIVEKVRINERGEGTYTYNTNNATQIYLYTLIVDGVKVETKKMVHR